MTKPRIAPPAQCGAYAIVDCYGQLAVPLEMVHLLCDAKRIDHNYVDGKNYYSLNKDQSLSFKVFGAAQMTAMFVAAKLEGAAS